MYKWVWISSSNYHCNNLQNSEPKVSKTKVYKFFQAAKSLFAFFNYLMTISGLKIIVSIYLYVSAFSIHS
jgi:hypothetical protein